MGIGAAIIGAGAIAGVASIGSGLIGASAAKSAAQTQANAATAAANLQMQEQQQVQTELAPYNVTGQSATNELASLYGLSSAPPTAGIPLSGSSSATTPGTITQPTSPTNELNALENTPGYQFALKQGLESTQSGAAARGLGTSGAALKGAANFAEGLAQNTYQANLLNPLTSLAQTGESAAAQAGSLGTTGAANAGAGLISAGNASAAGTIGAATATSNAVNGVGSALASTPLNYLLYQNLAAQGGGASGLFGNPSAAGYGTDTTSTW